MKRKIKRECEICGKTVEYLGKHIKSAHKIDGRYYYDKYLKTKGEGVCLFCEKHTKFRGISVGYGKYCSKKCMFSSGDYKKQMSVKNKGHIVTTETKQKISTTLIGHNVSKMTKHKISQTKKGCKSSLETRQKISESNKGHIVTPETKEKISKSHKGMKGISPSIETRRKISEANKGRVVSKETREKLRVALLKKVEEFCEKYGKPFIHRSKKEIECIDEHLKLVCRYRIDVDFRPIGYIVDGYIHEINLVIEFDEKYHENFKQKIKDFERQRNIEKELGCKFFRIKEDEWNNNKAKVIASFDEMIKEMYDEAEQVVLDKIKQQDEK